MSLYTENNIYKSEKLTKFIESLDVKYNPTDYISKYKQLVNFSQNTNVPFLKWFRYREGFAGKLILELLNDAELPKGGLVIDPFVGSGTTPVVGTKNGYFGFGLDVNPISTFISNIKLKNYSKNQIEELRSEIDKLEKSNISDVKKQYIDASVERYFNPQNFIKLNNIKSYIKKNLNGYIYDFFLCGLLCIIEDISDRRRDGNGLRVANTKVSDVKSKYLDKLHEMLHDIENSVLIEKRNVMGECKLGSAENLVSILSESNLSTKEFQKTIIFSPPYPNSFDYFESYKLELVIGDFAENITDISKFRKNAIRSFIGGKTQKGFNEYLTLLVKEIENKIPEKELQTGKKDTRTRKVPSMLLGYFYDMIKVIEQCYEVLNKGERVYIVVDQSAYLGIIIPTDILLSYFSENVGFNVISLLECRKARTSPQQLKKYPYLKEGLRETIIVLEK